jgi:hypothetical protein
LFVVDGVKEIFLIDFALAMAVLSSYKGAGYKKLNVTFFIQKPL